MRKTKKHKVYTIKEKNQIVIEYLDGQTSRENIKRKYDIASDSVFHRWVKQYRENGTTSDSRGGNNPNFGKHLRKKLNPEEMSHQELVEYVKAVEDIKKSMVFLKQQKKNIK
jgi:transposase-like protein